MRPELDLGGRIEEEEEDEEEEETTPEVFEVL